eukprot:4571729-Karenia_brevis.AAC.1
MHRVAAPNRSYSVKSPRNTTTRAELQSMEKGPRMRKTLGPRAKFSVTGTAGGDDFCVRP